MALAMRSRQGSGRTARDVVLISAIWLAFAGLIGLFAALAGSRRANSQPPSSAPDQNGKRPRSVRFGLGCLVFAGVCAGRTRHYNLHRGLADRKQRNDGRRPACTHGVVPAK
jgi:hypothetical protein